MIYVLLFFARNMKVNNKIVINGTIYTCVSKKHVNHALNIQKEKFYCDLLRAKKTMILILKA